MVQVDRSTSFAGSKEPFRHFEGPFRTFRSRLPPGPNLGFPPTDEDQTRIRSPKRSTHLTRVGLGAAPQDFALLLGAHRVDAGLHDPSRARLARAVFWNLGNYFDTDNDPTRQDDDFTPEGRYRWTESKLADKTDRLAEGLLLAGNGRPPDLAFLSEIETHALAERLAGHASLRDAGYQVVFEKGEDVRGISHAILSRFPQIGGAKLHKVHEDGERPTRGILEATFDVEGTPLTVFVNHWPSKRGKDAAQAHRERVAERLKQLIREKQALNPKAEILVAGDFNAHVDEAVFGASFLHALVDKDAVRDDPQAEALFHTIGDIAEKAYGRRFDSLQQIREAEKEDGEKLGTHVYRKMWSTLDGLIVSANLLDQEGLAYRDGSAEVIRHPKLLFKGFKPDRKTSDHLPVAATLEISKPVSQISEEGGGLISLRAKSPKKKRRKKKDKPKAIARPTLHAPGRSGAGVPFPQVHPEQFEGLEGPALMNAIRKAFQVRTMLSYSDAREVVFELHNRDGVVRSVYSNHEVHTDGVPDHDGPDGMNVEHTVPRSRGANGARKADLHNLYPTESVVNSIRSNHPFGVVTEATWEDPSGSGAKLGYDAEGNKVFEPPDEHKGNVARAMLYMKALYGKKVEITTEEEAYLVRWHEADPVDPEERTRSAAIRQVQGNENPFVAMPELFHRAAA